MAQLRKRYSIVLIALTFPTCSAEAQFGIDRAIKKFVPKMDRIQRSFRNDRRLNLRNTFGAVAAAAVGVRIFDALNKSERREVAKRTDKILQRDPDKEVVETYTTKSKAQTVTIKASPSQPATAFKDDAALQSSEKSVAPTKMDRTEESAAPASQQAPNASAASKPAQAAQPKPSNPATVASGETVKYADLSETTNCRKVETKLEPSTAGKSDPSKSVTNTAIICEISDGDWKPASL